MSIRKLTITSALVLIMISGAAFAQRGEVITVGPTAQVVPIRHTVLAVEYPENNGTEVDMIGTTLAPRARGEAEVKRKEGRTRIKLKMKDLGHPQALGGYYTTFILWAIAPEGQADNLAELQIKNEFDVEVTTAFQTFGLLITAEPHSAVKSPSPVVVAENALQKDTEGRIKVSRIDYRGNDAIVYLVSSTDAPALSADYSTPLVILGARNSVEIARRAGASQYAEDELRQAEIKLAALEQLWPGERKDLEKYTGMAHDVMRLGEQARELTVERIAASRLDAERQEARSTIEAAQTEADLARDEAAQARQEADQYREAVEKAEKEIALAHERVDQAQTEADRAKANEELARTEAERARIEAEHAKQDKAELEQRLYVSLSEILETRREARGLIVSLSDVLFDFNKASLKPGAREKLSKLAGILIAYPGNYHIEIEGHTDSIGTPEYNRKLSEDRADSVRYYLTQTGIAADRITGTRGLGEMQPVATNDTPEGRQMNRRVEIIITDTDNK